MREISVDMIGDEAFERIALMSQIEEELPDVPVVVVRVASANPRSRHSTPRKSSTNAS
jgi:hypothetical protein